MKNLTIFALAGFSVATSAQAQSTSKGFELNLYTLEANECGAVTSIPERCVSMGAAMCENEKQRLMELAVQFKPGTHEIDTLWFRCARANEDTQ